MEKQKMQIRYIGDTSNCSYTSHSFDEFKEFIKGKKVLALDIETNVVDSILDRELITVQISDIYGQINWVLQWSFLTEEEKEFILNLIQDGKILWLIFAAQFEGSMFKKLGATFKNIWDLYVVRKILHTGLTEEKGKFSLQGTLQRDFGVNISKAEQLLFGDNILTDEKIKYAAIDVAYLGRMYAMQLEDLSLKTKELGFKDRRGLLKTAWWDNQFILAVIDMEYQGILLDQNKWIENYNKAKKTLDEKQKELEDLLLKEKEDELIKGGFYFTEDTFDKKLWNSPKKKKTLLSLIFPDLEKTSELEIKKYLKKNDPDFPVGLPLTGKKWEESDYFKFKRGKFGLLKAILVMKKNDEVKEKINQFFFNEYRDLMVEKEFVIPKGTIKINWGSPVQKKEIFSWFVPEIESTSVQIIDEYLGIHPIFAVYKDFQEVYGLTTKFGIDYLKHVEADGRIRTRFKTVLNTGRLSAANPNVLQLPRNQDYRAAFIAPEGYKVVGADYAAEEALLAATFAKEHTWLEAVKHGYDLHSANAELIFGNEWKEAAEDDCLYYKEKKKCSCPKHKKLRDFAKTLGFGLLYGITEHGLSARLHIEKEEASELIHKFYTAFPAFKKFFGGIAKYALMHNRVMEPTLGRVRYFDTYKKHADPEGMVREASNFPIQSAGANILKIATVLLRRYLINNNLTEDIQIEIPVHDRFCRG